MPTIAKPSPLQKIDALALALSKQRAALSDLVATIDAEQRGVILRHRVALREVFGKTQGAQLALQAEIEANPELFVKPRTIVLHGVKVGYTKGKGRTVIIDEAKTIELIRKHLPEEQAGLLIRKVESVQKDALGQLTAAELKKIGVHVEAATDRVVLSYVDNAVDALITRLLEDAKEPGTEAKG